MEDKKRARQRSSPSMLTVEKLAFPTDMCFFWWSVGSRGEKGVERLMGSRNVFLKHKRDKEKGCGERAEGSGGST